MMAFPQKGVNLPEKYILFLTIVFKWERKISTGVFLLLLNWVQGLQNRKNGQINC